MGLQASTPEMARVITEISVMAAGYRQQVGPLAGFAPMARLLRAKKQDGTVVVFLPTDHIIWTERVASVAEDMVRQGKAEKAAGFEIWTISTFSDRARSDLKAMGWQTHEQARSKLVPQE